uniref:Uncharacterized protein n=1 Tax=Leptobrachium leishanense TaxID=445787 RepID=A0A8C5PK94_9ANUR
LGCRFTQGANRLLFLPWSNLTYTHENEYLWGCPLELVKVFCVANMQEDAPSPLSFPTCWAVANQLSCRPVGGLLRISLPSDLTAYRMPLGSKKRARSEFQLPDPIRMPVWYFQGRALSVGAGPLNKSP